MNYVVTVNGEKYEVEVERVGGVSSSLSRRPPERYSRPMQAAPAAQPAAAPQAAAPAPSAAPVSSGSANSIVSPMPGTVLDVKVKEGDAVAINQVVAILEAMKMETEIVSEFAGTVSAVKVKKGDAVDTDTVLMELK